MAKQSKQEQAIVRARERGMREVASPSRKYRAFESAARPGVYYFIGKLGAVRVGRTVSDSISLTDALPALGPER